MSVEVLPVYGLPEISPGDDLGALIAGAVGLEDHDVVAVTQKAVSKAEGRVVEGQKEEWARREARRIVARRGDLLIAETSHGFVCANAGVDASNVADGFVSLLPEDPDGSAERIRAGLGERLGRDVAVVVTDTFGRPWRRGLVNVAIGCAGLPALVDLRGTTDAGGRVLEATVVALADEVAATAGLVMGKADGVPVAVVRGLRPRSPSLPGRELIRPPEEDLFRFSPLTSIGARRTIREFAPGPVPREVLIESVAAALTAPVPHGSRHRRRPWTWVALESAPARRRLLGAMAAAWDRDLRGDGVAEPVIRRRLDRSDALLGTAPVLLVPFLSLSNADHYPDARRREAERDMFLLATGAAVQNLMLALHAQGFGSAWVSSSLFCKPEAAAAVGLDAGWLAMGSVVAGRAASSPPPPRPPIDPGDHLRIE
ncbi:MAG TPA: coenzyme F420-0:L-glutamate ligase [Actinomycetota bacterium]|nr:coenzyme F420-0:L-glutamate ligase [Actinomycetota bacterium]